ncbi:MAG: hypothetical protein JNL62_23415, partial [Bryobacterales bacterium]|nr:hypothetical protein [Bryobacterales bacterium]
MKNLKVYFDGRCGLCVAMVRWLDRQRQLVPLHCLPKQAGVDDLVVVADSGEYWRGDHVASGPLDEPVVTLAPESLAFQSRRAPAAQQVFRVDPPHG